MSLTIGIQRTLITPPWGVELAGLGYYLQRTWQKVRDDLAATALVAHDGTSAIALVAIDLMYMDRAFTAAVRQLVAKHTDIPAQAICVAASHSHNAPTAGFIRGAGERDRPYLEMAQRQAATAVISAWRQRRPATLHVGHTHLEGMTFNRTREGGAVDTQVSVLRADDAAGRPFALAVNFHAHPTIMLELGNTDVSRDYPGQVVDLLEQAYPGATALYLQGACGDVNFLRSWGQPSRCHEPGRALAGRALEALARARPIDQETLAAQALRVSLPTRRYSREEVMREHEEGRHRLATGDTTGWRDSLGRVMVNVPERFPERYGGDLGLAVKALARFAVDWTEAVLPELDTRPETLETEVQAFRLGDAYVVAQPAELFSSFALDLRCRWRHPDLMIVGYANEGIGYMPDAHDIARHTYAATQSPKFTGQFPFVPESGERFVDGMLAALEKAKSGE